MVLKAPSSNVGERAALLNRWTAFGHHIYGTGANDYQEEKAMPRVVPMVHVPDVRATVAWYESIGFTIRATHEEPNCPMDWASLFLGASEVMFSAGGRPASSPRRDVDLYVHVDDVDERYEAVAKRAEVVEAPHVTEYGMREFIVKDLNGFWLTFGQSASNG